MRKTICLPIYKAYQGSKPASSLFPLTKKSVNWRRGIPANEDIAWIRERLALGILRSDGIIEDMLPGKLSVKVNVSEEQQLIVLKQINLEDFEVYREPFDDMQVLEQIPEYVIFEHTSGTPRLEITLDLFELLMRMADGLLPDAQEYQPLQELAEDMVLQMDGSAQAIRSRFFDGERIDSALQRSYLANIIRFYFERSRRYQLFDPAAEAAFIEQLTRMEKSGLEYRPSYEGYIVSLESVQRKSLMIDTQTAKAVIKVLTAQDLEDVTWLLPVQSSSVGSGDRVADLVEESPYDEYPGIDDTLSPATWMREEKVETIASKDDNQPALENTLVEQTLTAPAEVIVPFGEATGMPVEWTPSTAGSPHLFIMGIPGQGKSWTITRILCELGKQNVPSLVLDFHGQFADPRGPFVRLIHPSVIDAAQGLPFSLFECTRENGAGGWKATSYALAEIFANVTGMGPMQRDIIYTAIQDAYRANGFEEEDIPDPDHPTSEEVLRRIRQEEQARHVNNVAARCRPLLEMDLFQPIKNAPGMLSSIRGGLVIDLHNLYAEELQLAAGAFVLRKLYRDMFTWGYSDRIRLVIVLDEAHRLARDVTLPKIMKEGRKFGIAAVVASQGIGDFHQDILNNAGTKVIFRINYPDSKKVAGFIRGRQGQDMASRIEQLSVGSAYVQTPEMPFGSVIQMYSLE